jgi:hypothetical protein
MELVKNALHSQLSPLGGPKKKETGWKSSTNKKKEIRCAVVYVSQLGCEGELGLLSAIQVCA